MREEEKKEIEEKSKQKKKEKDNGEREWGTQWASYALFPLWFTTQRKKRHIPTNFGDVQAS